MYKQGLKVGVTLLPAGSRTELVLSTNKAFGDLGVSEKLAKTYLKEVDEQLKASN